jgi:hypothetical protein
MRATKGLAVLLLGIVLAACTDNTGAIDQEGHNGFDRMSCNDFTALAKDVKYGAVNQAQARAAAAKLDDTAEHGGDPEVRQASAHLTAAYRANNRARVDAALAEFENACKW